jgi:hypothetical protein
VAPTAAHGVPRSVRMSNDLYEFAYS